MSYIVHNTDGSRSFEVPDRGLNTETALALVGRGSTGYSEPVFENLIKLLENFADTLPPPGILLSGQLWYDKGQKLLNVYNGSQWEPLATQSYVDANAGSGGGGTGGPITVSGDVTGIGTANTLVLNLVETGVVAGTYTKVTVDAKGRITKGQSLTDADIIAALGYRPEEERVITFPVTSVNSKMGDVVLTVADINGAAPKDNPTFTGIVRVAADVTAGSRIVLNGTSNFASVELSGTDDKFRVSRASDGGNRLEYDVTNGSLTIPNGLTVRNLHATDAVYAEGGTMVCHSSVANPTPSFQFQTSDGTPTGILTQDADHKITLSAKSSGSGWINSLTLDEDGNVTAVTLTASAIVASNSLVAASGRVASRNTQRRYFTFQRADGTATGHILQIPNPNPSMADGAIRIVASGNENDTGVEIDKDGNLVAPGYLKTTSGLLYIQPPNGAANGSKLVLTDVSGTEVASLSYDAASQNLVLRASQISAMQLTPSGTVHATAFLTSQTSAPNSGLTAPSSGILSLLVRGWPRFTTDTDGSMDTMLWFGAPLARTDSIIDGYSRYRLLLEGTSGSLTLSSFTRDPSDPNDVSETILWDAPLAVSDANLKTNIAPLDDGLATVRNLRAITFRWAEGHPLDDGRSHVGMIAQEVEALVPDAVAEVRGTKLLHKQELVPFLVRAVQQLDAENAALAAENDALKTRLTDLEQQVADILARLGASNE